MNLKKSFSMKKKNKKKDKVKEGRLWEDESDEDIESEASEDKTGFVSFMRNSLVSLAHRIHGIFRFPQKKYHIPYLLRAKRVLAGIYLFFFVVAGISAFSFMSIVFFGAAYIFVDYLWKIRQAEWVFK